MEQTDLTVFPRGGNFWSFSAEPVDKIISRSSGLKPSPEKDNGPLSCSVGLCNDVLGHPCLESLWNVHA